MPKIDHALANLIAFLSVVVTIAVLALNANNAVDLSIMTGLVGVLGSFKPWESLRPSKDKVEIEQPAGAPPIPVTETHPAEDDGALPEEQRI